MKKCTPTLCGKAPANSRTTSLLATPMSHYYLHRINLVTYHPHTASTVHSGHQAMASVKSIDKFMSATAIIHVSSTMHLLLIRSSHNPGIDTSSSMSAFWLIRATFYRVINTPPRRKILGCHNINKMPPPAPYKFSNLILIATKTVNDKF